MKYLTYALVILTALVATPAQAFHLPEATFAPAKTPEEIPQAAKLLQEMFEGGHACDAYWETYSYRFCGDDIAISFPSQPELFQCDEGSILLCVTGDSGRFFMICATPNDTDFVNDLENPDQFITDLNASLRPDRKLMTCDIWNSEELSIADLVILVERKIYLKARLYVTQYNTFVLTTADDTIEHSDNTLLFFNSFSVESL